MADQMRITNMPESGSPERIAYDLLIMVFNHEGKKKMTREEIFDLYTECLYAVRGFRDLPKR